MNNSESGHIAILCSGVALGVYNPALTLRSRLLDIGRQCRIYVLENLHNVARRENILQAKKAFHRNFSLACNSQKMAGNIADTFESDLIDKYLEQWIHDGITTFCIFSGFWLPIVNMFKKQHSHIQYNIHLCYMDAVPSTSWKLFVNESTGCIEHRMFNYQKKEVSCQLAVSSQKTPPLIKRNKRFVIHGGGWGMGTYKLAIDELSDANLSMDIICYEQNDIIDRGDTVRNFMIDPEWKPWEQISGDYTFPPFAEVKKGITPDFTIPDNHPDVYDLASSAMGIISKPGGATLLDSFSSATPLIFLPETFGEYEKKNGELWQTLGFGIDFSTWKASNYSTLLLNDLHQNILRYKENNKPPTLEEEIAYAT